MMTIILAAIAIIVILKILKFGFKLMLTVGVVAIVAVLLNNLGLINF